MDDLSEPVEDLGGSTECLSASIEWPSESIEEASGSKESPIESIGWLTDSIGSLTDSIGPLTDSIESITRSIGSPDDANPCGAPWERDGSPSRQAAKKERRPKRVRLASNLRSFLLGVFAPWRSVLSNASRRQRLVSARALRSDSRCAA
jgi:hypothetical protein